MANKLHRVPTADAVRVAGRTIEVEHGATKGAVVGRNLVLEDGTIVTVEMILNVPPAPDDDFPVTYWRLLREIPPNIVAIAALTGGGFAFMDSVGVWRVRRLGRQVINFAFGDASPAVIWTAPHDLYTSFVKVIVDTPFNGAGPGIQVGSAADPDLLFPAAAADLSVAATYRFDSEAEMLSGENIQATITPGGGASAGAGRIIIDTIPLEGL